jgi:hypothetical protein
MAGLKKCLAYGECKLQFNTISANTISAHVRQNKRAFEQAQLLGSSRGQTHAAVLSFVSVSC